LFGGVKGLYDESDIREVWVFEPTGNSWHEMGYLKPSVVIAAAFDEESQRVILFGRQVTWAFDPLSNTWERMNPEEHPSKRWSSQMAYDVESDRIVLFGGGTSSTNNYDDTWVYDFNTDSWTEMQPDVSPPGRGYHGMAYDPQSDRTLLWGGGTGTKVSDSRVWAYDYNTNTWTTQDAPSDAPEQRAGIGLFYHPPSGRMIVYGGLSENYTQMAEETTWAYDYRANSWGAIAPSTNVGKRAYIPMAYAPSVDKAVLFGGELTGQSADDISDETWIFDPATDEWSNVTKP
jgi:hypothetical protein